MNGLRGVNHRLFGARTLFAHGMVRTIKRVERGVRQPSFVEVQVFHITIEHALDGFGVVEHTVIRRLSQRQDTRFDLFGVHALEQRILLDLGLDGRGFELALGNWADDAEMVAGGLEEDRYRAGHDDRVQDGFVAIAVHHHHIAWRHSVVPNHLVGGAGAVGHKKAVIGIENAGRVALALANGTVVVQQLTEFFHRVANVGAQHVLTIELVVHLAHRTLEEGYATRVTRAMPRVRTVFGVIQQRLEKRWLQALQVTLGLTDDVARHEFWRVFVHVDEAMQLAQDVIGQMLAGLGLAVNVDRHIGILAAHFVDEGTQIDDSRVEIRAW